MQLDDHVGKLVSVVVGLTEGVSIRLLARTASRTRSRCAMVEQSITASRTWTAWYLAGASRSRSRSVMAAWSCSVARDSD